MHYLPSGPTGSTAPESVVASMAEACSIVVPTVSDAQGSLSSGHTRPAIAESSRGRVALAEHDQAVHESRDRVEELEDE